MAQKSKILNKKYHAFYINNKKYRMSCKIVTGLLIQSLLPKQRESPFGNKCERLLFENKFNKEPDLLINDNDVIDLSKKVWCFYFTYGGCW